LVNRDLLTAPLFQTFLGIHRFRSTTRQSSA
jgi:hypothetical protein